MTEKSNDESDQSVAEAKPRDGDAEGDDAQFADLNLSTEESSSEGKPSRLPLLLSVIALIVAGLTFASGAYRSLTTGDAEVVNDGAAAEQIASLSAELKRRDSQLDELERRLTRLDSRPAPTATPVDVEAIERRIQNRLQERLRLIESVPSRVASLESALTALRGISTGARDAWLLAEAEYYLQIGNAQLQLAGNPTLATLALKLADERIEELGDPGMTDVRRVLTGEIRTLEALEAPDVEGATLALAGLSQVVDSLPLQERIVLVSRGTAKPDADLSGTDRALATLKNAMSDVVSVRRTDEAARPLIAPDAVYFLRANLSLQLQAARLAMLRGEQALFQQSLDDAAAWLREYYDTERAPVRSALQTISEIRQSSLTRAMPDISGSLRLIREYIAFIEASRVESAGNAARAPAAQSRPTPSNVNRSRPVSQRIPASASTVETPPPAAPESVATEASVATQTRGEQAAADPSNELDAEDAVQAATASASVAEPEQTDTSGANTSEAPAETSSNDDGSPDAPPPPDDTDDLADDEADDERNDEADDQADAETEQAQ